jgi:hypothetical protein
MSIDVYIPSHTTVRLWTMIEQVSTEVGGFGYAFWDEKTQSLIWDDVFLVPQFVSHSEVAFDGDGIAIAVERAIEDEVLQREDFVWVSWHSHHSMKAFWSITDESCIETYAKSGVTKLLSFVGCHDHDYRMRLDCFNVKHAGITLPTVTLDELKLVPDPADKVIDDVLDEIQQNVKKRPVQAVKAWTSKNKSLPGAKLDKALAKVAADHETWWTTQSIEWDDDEYNGFSVGPTGLTFEEMGS